MSNKIDKANSRVARIRCDVMKVDKMITMPTVQAIHGLRVKKVPHTKYVICNGEFKIPMNNDGKESLEDGSTYRSLFNVIDAEKMEVAFQVMVDGNLDDTDADYSGKYFGLLHMGMNLAEMITAERDHLDNLPQTGKILSLASGITLINDLEPESKTDNFKLSLIYSKLPDSVKSVLFDPYLSEDGK